MSAMLPIALMVAHTGLAVNQVPDFDVGPTCHPNQTSLAACRRDEQDARQKLHKQWRDFTRAHRVHCERLTTLGGDPSYVELLTCLQIAKQTRNLSPKHLLEGNIKPKAESEPVKSPLPPAGATTTGAGH